MKKYFLILAVIAFSIPVFADIPPNAAIIQVHDMQMINDQRFRMEEINDYNDVQTEKERYRKRNESPQQPFINKLFGKKKFVDDNGQIKIENN